MAERRLGIGRRSGGGKIDVKIALQSQYRIGFNFTIMTSLKDARDLLLLSFGQGLIDEADFLILYDINSSGNLSYPYKKYGRFHLEEKDSAECKTEFRFEKNDIPLLAEALDVPEVFKCHQGTVCDGIEGLCMLLKRFAYPCRYSDMVPCFGRPVAELAMISNKVTDFIYEQHNHRLTRWNDTILNPLELENYANAVNAKGAPLGNCFGFIDGTVRPICRPDKDQRIVYNGHKRVHALKFQSVVIPNGLIANLYGPVDKFTWLRAELLAPLWFHLQSHMLVYSLELCFGVSMNSSSIQ